MRNQLETMLRELAPLIDAAADVGNFPELHKLIDRRDALVRLLEHVPDD